MSVEEQFNEFSPKKAALLRLLVDNKRTRAATLSLTRSQRPDALPLSHAQERLWLLEQIGVLGSAYNLPAAVRLRGLVDVAALQRALALVVERHEVLRTRFAVVDGSPVQVIDPAGSFELVVEDLSELPEDERAAAARERIGVLAKQPFALAHGPLFQGRLLRLSEKEHIAVVVMHHIVSDGWSIGVLIREVGALYAAFAAGRPSPLPALPVQYADYALWQRSRLQGDALEKQVSYWREHLTGAPTVLDLPTDRPRPAVQSYRGESFAIGLPAELTASLDELARSEGATLFMVLLAAFNVVLSRWSGQEDVVVGSPIAGRSHRELEGLIGFFINTLPLRTDLKGDPSFTELLGRVKETALDGYAHQEVPFEKLLEVLQPKRDLSRQPIFQVLFALQNVPRERLQLPGLELRRLPGQQTTAKLDLSLYVYQREGGLEGYFEYATDLFDASTIRRLSSHFKTLLESIVAAPEARLSDLALLDTAERHQLMVEWNDTAAAYPKDKCLHELFVEQAARTPDAVAIVYDDSELTYDDLDRRSNQLAHHLRGLGVGPDVIVGLSIDRSPDMVVGLLGILKAGGAYLPLDPAYPPERLAYMMSDAGISLVLAQHGGAMAGLAVDPIALVCLDAETDAIAGYPIAPPRAVGVTSQNLAYVLYTSGSTGKPKGVMGTHGAVVNRLHWDAAVPSGEELYVQKTTPNFIDMLWEVFMPLMRGQRIVIAGESCSRDIHRLIELLGKSKTSRIVLVPSLMQAMLEVEDVGGRLPDLRYWACSGEALSSEMAKLFYECLPNARLFNVYGASEFWDASWSAVDQNRCRHGVPIGRPIPNIRAFVLDAAGEVVPIGISGELYIGGAGLARGYLGRAALTADRFVPSPFGDGERLYRTGDLARWRADGELEYLGRIDHQVKLRGLRIELGEIEARLLEHPDVGQAVVVAREDAAGDKRLAAYVVGHKGAAIDAGELRGHLKRSLPEHMVPATFVLLDALPLTSNGKIDRRRLPAPENGAVVGVEYVAPQTPGEQVLAAIWCEVLKLEWVGINDNFFELGGHSLLATRLMARIRDAFRIELPLRTLFDAPCVGELTALIETAQQEGLGLATPTLLAQARPQVLPLSHAQERLWLLEQIGGVGSAYNMPAAVRLQGDLDVSVLELSFAAVIERHESLRTRFAVVDGSPVQLIEPPGRFGLQIEDLSQLPEDERAAASQRLARALAQQPFDLERGPLFRGHLIRLSAQDHIAVVTMHHIVSDGWSVGVLIRETGTLYSALSQGLASPLPELPVHYADYALWQRGWLRDETLEKQIGYWRQRLSGAPAALELPTDRPRPAVQTYRGLKYNFALPAQLVTSLNELARSKGSTLFMVMLAAFQLLLKRHSGQDDIVVGSPIAGRTRRELEGLIGFFVNTLVIRTQVADEFELQTASGAGQGDRTGGICASGFAVREIGRGTAAGA